MKVSVSQAILAIGLTVPFGVNAAPVDLTGWLAEGEPNSNWIVAADNNSVRQTFNGAPTVFHNNTNSQGNKLSGTISVGSNWDDDYIGFVLGYNANDLTNTTADYILIDWKKRTQGYLDWGTATEGLSISRVTSPLQEDRGAWAHVPSYGVTELARATTLGSTGWDNNVNYSFDLNFHANLIEVFVNGNKELSVSGSFANGSFGFYNFSQENVTYAGIQEDVLPPQPAPVPVPAAMPLLGVGLAMFAMLRRKRRAA